LDVVGSNVVLGIFVVGFDVVGFDVLLSMTNTTTTTTIMHSIHQINKGGIMK
jgi:hypothetical protein